MDIFTHILKIISTFKFFHVYFQWNFQTFYFPENTGFPIGGPNRPGFLFLEIHYDNQAQSSGKDWTFFKM